MAVFEEVITPKELICELTLAGALAGHYSIRENVAVNRDGERFSSQDRVRLLSDAAGAAIVGGDTAAALAQVQAAQSQIAELQSQKAAVEAERDAALAEVASLRSKAAAAIAAAQPLVTAIS